MATSTFSKVDEYGFERSSDFDYKSYETFMSQYIRTLAKRSKRWEDLSRSNKLKKNNTLKRFVRKGIPISERESMWLVISGASDIKNNAPVSYNALKKRIDNPSIVEIIEIDVPRTFPDNIFFAKDSEFSAQLFNVLATFAHQNKDVGYCQGLNYIAGLLLLATKNEESTFWLLKALIENILPRYYVSTMSGLLIDLDVLDELVQKNEPAVYSHIKKIGMPWAVSSTKWFICLYAEVLPTETVLRIWDCLFYEGSKILFRVALALIKLHKEEILETNELSELVACFREMGSSFSVIDCHHFMDDVFKVPSSFSNKKLEKLRNKHTPNGTNKTGHGN